MLSPVLSRLRPNTSHSSGTRIRVSRTKGWIEVIAPLVNPSVRGHFHSNPFPMVRAGDYSMYQFHLSYVNFDKMTRFDTSHSEEWCKIHLLPMFDDREAV